MEYLADIFDFLFRMFKSHEKFPGILCTILHKMGDMNRAHLV